MKKERYRPFSIFISRNTNKHSDELYDLENVRSEAIRRCADQFLKVVKHDNDKWDDFLSSIEFKSELWDIAIPQALYDTLNSYTTLRAIAAAKAFLEDNGYEVKEKE